MVHVALATTYSYTVMVGSKLVRNTRKKERYETEEHRTRLMEKRSIMTIE